MATINQHPAFQQPQGGQSVREIPITDSKFIQFFKYDPNTYQLTVVMKNGGEYVHYYVYPMVIDQLVLAPSKGKFYAENIKGKLPGIKIVDKSVGPRGGKHGHGEAASRDAGNPGRTKSH